MNLVILVTGVFDQKNYQSYETSTIPKRVEWMWRFKMNLNFKKKVKFSCISHQEQIMFCQQH